MFFPRRRIGGGLSSSEEEEGENGAGKAGDGALIRRCRAERKEKGWERNLHTHRERQDSLSQAPQAEVGSANKHQTKSAPKAPLIPRQKRMALPQIPKGDKDLAKPGQKRPCLPARSSHAKATPLGNHDMTPWAGPSQSETSFHALFKPMVSFLHSVPFSAVGSPGSCPFFPDLGEKGFDAEGKQRQKAVLIQGKAKQKGRSRGSPRRLQNKWEAVTLPPVPRITNLSFSPNFTFSFFELPPHQSQQSWVQRQQLICLLMKQLK
ncbi:uncharacterized protein LOC103277983 isoform X2 [Anolis carolinensis]|uniref:uncharacterized protein LOC103277983 isoform X2 n=1 Tax=Anolis carolinensis TaxID=28377 RepID=UPI002F2B8251